MKVGNHVEDMGLGERVILKWILNGEGEIGLGL